MLVAAVAIDDNIGQQMDIFLLLLRLALAGVFGTAGIAKALDPDGSKRAFIDFGLPVSAAKILVYMLPAVEIAIAVMLFFPRTSWYAAIGGTALLLVFTSGMLYQLAKGKSPDCHCFGQIYSEPVGVSSIVRNIVIMAPAGLLAVQGPREQGPSIVNTNNDIFVLVLGLAIVTMLVISVIYLKTLLAQQTKLMRRIEILELTGGGDVPVEREDLSHPRDGLPLGALVPNFELPDLDGNSVSLEAIKSAGKAVLFMHVSPGCAPCQAMKDDLANWERDLADRVRFVFISSGTAAENRKKFAGVDGRIVLLEQDEDFFRIFRAKWTPMAVLMDAKGRIASFTAAGDFGIRELVGKIESAGSLDDFTYFVSAINPPPARVRIGESVPEFSATDINGNALNQTFFNGRPTLITFWSKGCQFCGPMMDEIREWDAKKNGTDPNLIIFGDGDREEHLALGLKSPMIIDEHQHFGVKLGQYGTPSGILIDENGRFVSETAIGAEDIWSLIGRKN